MNTRTMVKIGIAAAFSVFFCGAIYAQSFHNKGDLVCTQCHTLHDSEDGADVGDPGAQAMLLKQADTTDLCLSCHNGDNAGWPNVPDVLNVGAEPVLSAGDFQNSIADDGRGHNPGGAIGADATLGNTPPGGLVLANALTCATCHDPHGTGGTVSFDFRNLWKNVNGFDVSAAITSADADEATLLSGSNNVAVDNTNHNVYKGSVGAWCAACHSNPDNGGSGFHGASVADTDVGDGSDWIRHPTDTAIGATYTTNYNTVGQYSFDYPLVQVGGTWTTTTQSNVAATDKVFCLSCHFAHASANANATRWNVTTATGIGAKCSRCHDK